MEHRRLRGGLGWGGIGRTRWRALSVHSENKLGPT